MTAWVFPEWFIAQYEVKEKESSRRSRPLVHRTDLEKRQYVFNRKRYRVVPVRFVQACTRGHVSDIDWRLFVHGADDKCLRQPLWMDERGTSGDLSEIVADKYHRSSGLLQPRYLEETASLELAVHHGYGSCM